MFTGLVEEQGRVVSVDHQPDDAALITIAAPGVLEDVDLGDSIAVNGVCLTVSELGDGRFTADMMAETLERTTLGGLVAGSPVNLERAVLASTRLGGHMVQGHVDGVGEIGRIDPAERWTTLTIVMPETLAGYVAEKGSIAVDGVSLTVTAVSESRSAGSAAEPSGSEEEPLRPEDDPADSERMQRDAPPANTVADHTTRARDWFQVSLIPTTQAETTFGNAVVGRRVNLEVDVIAKYVERLLAVRPS